MKINPIQKIVIVGGGTAGWLTAALFSKVFSKNVSVTLVESDQIGTVGVGEATVPPLRILNNLLGINEHDFLKNTNGTYKVGIQFKDWLKKGHTYFHPFGKHGDQFGVAPFHQYWLRLFLMGKTSSIDDFSLCSVSGQAGRFNRPPTQDRRSIWSTYNYAYHFDASSYAKYLMNYAIQRGVNRIEGKINHVTQNKSNGFIDSIHLENGNSIHGELFIDCSGFHGVLIDKALKVPYHDWAHWLPCDRAVAVPCENGGDFVPFTRSTAHPAGWQWRIPLQHRIGNGHVFSSSHMSDDEATSILLNNVDGAAIAEPRVIHFRTGVREKIWYKNVVSIGLSSGFLEPLESTSIHLIQTGATRLISWLTDLNFEQKVIDEFNRLHLQEVERIRDFIILHYCATERDDTEFWRYCKNMDIPDELKNKIEMFRLCGKLIDLPGDFFHHSSWLAVMLGQGILPNIYDPLTEHLQDDNLEKALTTMRELIKNTAMKMPSLGEYIAEHCSARIEKFDFIDEL